LAEQILSAAMEGYDHIVSVNIPEKLSATINNVRLGAKGKALAGKVTVLDSGTLTMGLGMQVLVAAEVAAQTGDVNQVVAAVEKVRQHQKLYAIIAELEYLRRSGRVNGVIAFLGSLLQIKPILDVHDGEVDVAERARTFKKATSRLQELIEAQAPLDRLVILQINNEAGAKELITALGTTAPADTMIISVGPTLGVHIGPGSLGAITLKKSWRG
jgi:DegV family protein with EDD domain